MAKNNFSILKKLYTNMLKGANNQAQSIELIKQLLQNTDRASLSESDKKTYDNIKNDLEKTGIIQGEPNGQSSNNETANKQTGNKQTGRRTIHQTSQITDSV